MLNMLRPGRESVSRFDAEVGRYFARTRRFRIHMKGTGTVLLVDSEGTFVSQLRNASQLCNQDLTFAHVDTVQDAESFVENNETGILLVLCHVDLLSNGNGYSFLTWMRKNHPTTPVFVRECTQKEEERVRRFYSNTGIFLKGRTDLRDYLQVFCVSNQVAVSA